MEIRNQISEKKTTGLGILEVAKANYRNRFCNYEEFRPLYDSYGKVGYLCEDVIILAREYVWRGEVLSVQDNLLKYAEDKGKCFMIYVLNQDKFLKFTTQDIRYNFVDTNLRGTQVMFNFTVK